MYFSFIDLFNTLIVRSCSEKHKDRQNKKQNSNENCTLFWCLFRIPIKYLRFDRVNERKTKVEQQKVSTFHNNEQGTHHTQSSFVTDNDRNSVCCVRVYTRAEWDSISTKMKNQQQQRPAQRMGVKLHRHTLRQKNAQVAKCLSSLFR